MNIEIHFLAAVEEPQSHAAFLPTPVVSNMHLDAVNFRIVALSLICVSFLSTETGGKKIEKASKSHGRKGKRIEK